MLHVIGTDEAGFGPNLGPLVVSATVWQMPGGIGVEDLFDRLAAAVAPTAAEAGAGRIAIADSKKLYQPGGSLRHLERGVLAGLASLGHSPASWRGLLEALDPAGGAGTAEIPWYAGYDQPIPVCGENDTGTRGQRFLDTCRAVGVRLCAIRSRVVEPHAFNARLARCGNKSTLLSEVTLGLAAELTGGLPGPLSIICDKHGGRNRYADMLAQHFPEAFIEIHGESRHRSAYRFGPAERRIDAAFLSNAERCLPVALASMASKYLRELAMRAFNGYWAEHVSDLRPTAGYPQDARRFKKEIAAAQERLGISDAMLWRAR
ncbi:MAG: hypothetical protein PHO07_08970 [Pirellulales bacterium]|jgi:hypothetical protein|nr:hypothetical protein [Thermoguttaceae bacterium]MDD4787291.1 hypothetical protein [Pirellulales bacterium]MDI9445971.1 hypothetical protein [Planctomycetota bacterium]NLZ02458.1 hypothetical protein [Pirellulaceae bacterium]